MKINFCYKPMNPRRQKNGRSFNSEASMTQLGEGPMPIKYYPAPEIKKQVDQLAQECEFFHVVPQYVYCIRSRGSKARRTIARIHGLGKVWQGVFNMPAAYTIEVISEINYKMSDEEKEKTLIHEIMHIPGGFSGGFRPHKGYVERKDVEAVYAKLKKSRAAKRSLMHF
jgi:predicted metallopeptidase